jgi:hypothetical protein
MEKSTSFKRKHADISVEPIVPDIFYKENIVSFNIKNNGNLANNSGDLTVTLKDSNNTVIYEQTADVGYMDIDEVKNIDFEIPIDKIVFGNYRLSYILNYDEGILRNNINIPNDIAINMEFDRHYYRAGDDLNYTLLLQNTGKFKIDGEYNITNADIPVSISDNFEFNPNMLLKDEFNSVIPIDINSGDKKINVNVIQGESVREKKFYFTIIPSQLFVDIPDQEYTAGGSFIIQVNNKGGVGTEHKISVSIDKQGKEILNEEITDNIAAGEIKEYEFTLPLQIADGLYYLSANVYDIVNDATDYEEKIITIGGINLQFVVKTDKNLYSTTEDIIGTGTITNHDYQITDAKLDLKIIEKGDLKTEEWDDIEDYTEGCIRNNVVLNNYGDLLLRQTRWERGYWDIEDLPKPDDYIGRPIKFEIDDEGNYYIVQNVDPYTLPAYHEYIWKFSPEGEFLIKWGANGVSGAVEYWHPCAIVYKDGYVFVADGQNYCIRKFDKNGNFIKKWGSSSELGSVLDFATDENYIYALCGKYYREVRKYDIEGNYISSFTPPSATEIEFHDNYLYFGYYSYIWWGSGSPYSQWKIIKTDESGTVYASWTKKKYNTGRYDGFYGFDLDSNGNLYYVSRIDDEYMRIYKRDADLNFIGMSEDSYEYAIDIIDADDNLLLLDQHINEISGNFEYISRWGRGVTKGVTPANNFNKVVFDYENNLAFGKFMYPDLSIYSYAKFDLNGNFIDGYGQFGNREGDSGKIQSPININGGYVYIFDNERTKLQKWDYNGNFIKEVGELGTEQGQLRSVTDIRFDEG